MVRILVVSDSHGDYRPLDRVRAEIGQVDLFIHAGDYYQDAARIAARLDLDPGKVRAVVGNCDVPLVEPAEAIIEVEGVQIWLTHGHLFGVKRGIDRLYYAAKERGVRVAIFGHTHVPVNIDDNGLLLLNPGSLSLPYVPGDSPSFATLEIENGRVAAQIHYMLHKR